MSEASAQHPDPSGKDSISRVLDGEKQADARLAEGRRDAERIRHAAVAEERRIAARADRRLKALHGAVQAMIEAERARLAQAFEAERHELSTPPDADEIATAADRLARRLIGLDST